MKVLKKLWDKLLSYDILVETAKQGRYIEVDFYLTDENKKLYEYLFCGVKKYIELPEMPFRLVIVYSIREKKGFIAIEKDFSLKFIDKLIKDELKEWQDFIKKLIKVIDALVDLLVKIKKEVAEEKIREFAEKEIFVDILVSNYS